jgi:hypothetical protein
VFGCVGASTLRPSAWMVQRLSPECCAAQAADFVANNGTVAHTCACMPGYFDSGSLHPTNGTGCTQCTPVANAASVSPLLPSSFPNASCFVQCSAITRVSDLLWQVTCTALGNSRANCSAGYMLVPGTGGASDTCSLPSCAFYANNSGSPCPSTQFVMPGAPAPNGTCASTTCTTAECCGWNVCTCQNGVPGGMSTNSNPAHCPTNGAEFCIGCDVGYFLNTATRTCEACTPVVNAYNDGFNTSNTYDCDTATDSHFVGPGDQCLQGASYAIINSGVTCATLITGQNPANTAARRTACVNMSNGSPTGCTYVGVLGSPGLVGCGGQSQNPCCADGYHHNDATSGSVADQCVLCSQSVPNAAPVSGCIPRTNGTTSAAQCSANVTSTMSLLDAQYSCRRAGCDYFSAYRCTSPTNSMPRGCADGASPPNNAYTAGGYASACNLCSAGNYGTGGFCHLCAAGNETVVTTNVTTGSTQVASSGATGCIACLPGQFNANPAAGFCAICLPGSQTDTGSSVGGTSCTACTAGQYSAVSTAACAVCSPGSQTMYCQSVTAAAGVCESVAINGTTPAQRAQSCTSTPGCSYSPRATTSATACDQCDMGKFSATSTTACADCAYNTFSSTTGQVACATCPLGSLTGTVDANGDGQLDDPARPGATMCASCPSGRQSTRGLAIGSSTIFAETGCSNCAAGTYSDVNEPPINGTCYIVTTNGIEANIPFCMSLDRSTCESSTQCVPLPGGANATTCTAAGTSNCAATPGCVVPSTACQFILPGRFCLGCLRGKYQSQTQQDTCHFCPAGSVTRRPSEGDGSYMSIQCGECAQGQTSSLPWQSCASCAAGSEATIRVCAPGNGTHMTPASNVTVAQQDVCFSRFNASTASTAAEREAACEVPPPTSFLQLHGLQATGCTYMESVPTPCSALTSSGATACNAALGCSFVSNVCVHAGATTCLACGSGRASPVSTTACSDCSAGSYSPGAAATCTDCELGRYQGLSAQSTCLFCGDGYETLNASNASDLNGGAVNCAACPAGYYSNHTENSAACYAATNASACSAPSCHWINGVCRNLFTSTMACSICHKGSYSPTIASGACTQCEGGRYQANSTQTSCITCISGSHAEKCVPTAAHLNSATVIANCRAVVITGTTTAARAASCNSITNCRYYEATSSGATACAQCEAGQSSLQSTNPCVACNPGSVTRTIVGENCSAPAGSLPSLAISCAAVSISGADAAARMASCENSSVGGTAGCVYYAPFHSSAGASLCLSCPAEYFSPVAITDCSWCGDGNMTAHNGTSGLIQDAVFAATGATVCAPCYIPTSAHTLPAQQAETCWPVGSRPTQADVTLCAGLLTGQNPAQRNASCISNTRCRYIAEAGPGSRGFADLDDTSSTACSTCQHGTFASSVDRTECADFDECASIPCENGATCSQPTLLGTSMLANPSPPPATFSCACSHGFSGRLCQLLNECALQPCTVFETTVPRSETAQNRFLCPVTMQCSDPDIEITDNYQCTCPACDTVTLSSSTASLLGSYFSTHPAYSHHVARVADQIVTNPNAQTCRDPTVGGCTDSAALNYDPAASVQTTACIPKAFGCMDRRAINYNSSATAYDPDSQDSSKLCHGAYCVSAPACVSIFSHTTGGGDASIAATCSAVDSQFNASDDVYARMTACETAGVGLMSGYSTVCRYRPRSSQLCPHSHMGGTTEIHGGAADCSCPNGTCLSKSSVCCVLMPMLRCDGGYP